MNHVYVQLTNDWKTKFVPVLRNYWEELFPSRHFSTQILTNYFRKILENKTRNNWLLTVDDSILGFIFFSEHTIIGEDQPTGWVHECYVIPSLRKSGIGKQMIRDAIDYLTRSNIKRVGLQVAYSNEVGRRFWEKIGFHITGHIMELPLQETQSEFE